MPQESLNLYHESLVNLSEKINLYFPNHLYNHDKHVILLKNENFEIAGQLRLPLFWEVRDHTTFLKVEAVVLYLTISASHAAICVTKGTDNHYHTTFSAYTTRKKQGVSQIKYLNKKGKSRAGSRVRLAATLELFESINLKLNELFETYEIQRIGINCSPTLIPYLMQSKIPCPFEKSDLRLYKIPLHIQQSNFSSLEKAIKKLMAPIIQYDSELMDPKPIWPLSN